MSNGITLTSAMRNNLGALKYLSGQMDITQTRLATGQKVNSAIDNASSFYQARALTNRASDLDRLLDSMGQSIQTINAAISGLEQAGATLEQAAVVAQQAYEAAIIPEKAWFEAQVGENGAVVSTAQELRDAINSGKETICVYGKIDYFENQSITLKAGQKLVGVGAYGIEEAETDKFSQLNLNGGRIYINYDEIKLSDLSIKFKNTRYGILVKNVETSLAMHNMDLLAISQENGRILTYGSINMTGTNSLYGTGATGFHSVTYSNINLDGKLNVEGASWALNNVTINAYNNSEINVKSTYKGASSCNINLYDNSKMVFISDVGFQYGSINLYDSAEYFSNKHFQSIEGYSQQINLNSSNAKMNIKDSYSLCHNSGGSQIINAVKGATINFNDEIYRAENDIVDYQTGTGTRGVPNVFSLVSEGNEWEIDDLAWLSERNSAREWEYNYKAMEFDDSKKQYNEIMSAYDDMIKDSSYQGINLLTGGKLTTMFNETRSNSFKVEGANMTAESLGITMREWQTKEDIAQSIKEIKDAMYKVRDMVEVLGNNLSIIETRMNFTDALTDILQIGADELVLADMNEESANYLALQTRQQLAVNALSLAAQSSSAVLKLF